MKWFLAFLASNVVTFTYATIILYAHFRKLLQNVKEDDAATTFLQLWLSLLRTDVLVGSLFLFAGMCDILVTFFLVYHSYLVFSGVTTNETLKFEDIKQAIEARELDLYQRGPDQFYLDLAGKPGRVTWKELENIYDKGWKNNLRSILQSRA